MRMSRTNAILNESAHGHVHIGLAVGILISCALCYVLFAQSG